MTSLDVLFLTYNRLEFTRLTLALLLRHTDWARVRQLVVIDDGSEDGTIAYVRDVLALSTVAYRIVTTGNRSPVEAMARYLGDDPAEWFAKIDNDVCVPDGWLGRMLDVLDRHPEVDLLGMESGMTRVVGRGPGFGDEPWDGVYGFEPSTHIGGIGVMRTAAFAGRKLRGHGRNGFTEFQHLNPTVVRGWITPDLPVPLLDRMPTEPFLGWSARYDEMGWQRERPWGKYDPVFMAWAFEWLESEWVEPELENGWAAA